jgi:signal peptidase I
VISKLAYAFGAAPQRGDMVIHRAPEPRGPDQLKRIVAVAGETVEVREGRLVLNGEVVGERSAPGACIEEERDDRTASWYGQPCVAFIQTLGSTTFAVHHMVGETLEDFGPITVPPGQVFLMGDNRDRSRDSRYYGPLPVEKIKGRVFGILWSAGPHGIRWDRVLAAIPPPTG